MEGCFWGRPRTLPDDGEIDDGVVWYFTRGQCHALARAIYERTGWELAMLTEDEDDLIGYGHHVVCLTPQGDVVDIEGLRDPWEVEEEYGCDLVRVGPEVLDDLDGNEGWDVQDMDTARKWVDPVLEEIGWTVQREPVAA